jgi:hypothetical protein
MTFGMTPRISTAKVTRVAPSKTVRPLPRIPALMSSTGRKVVDPDRDAGVSNPVQRRAARAKATASWRIGTGAFGKTGCPDKYSARPPIAGIRR